MGKIPSEIGAIALILLFHGTVVRAGAPRYENCTPTEASVLEEAQARAADLATMQKRWIEEALDDASRVNRGGSTDRKLRHASRMLDCAARQLDHLRFRCIFTPNQKELASISWIFGKNIRINTSFFKESALIRGAVVLHEATHKCGTTDAAYFNQGDVPRDTGFVNWPMIADTYEYWATLGFCIPGETCARGNSVTP